MIDHSRVLSEINSRIAEEDHYSPLPLSLRAPQIERDRAALMAEVERLERIIADLETEIERLKTS